MKKDFEIEDLCFKISEKAGLTFKITNNFYRREKNEKIFYFCFNAVRIIVLY